MKIKNRDHAHVTAWFCVNAALFIGGFGTCALFTGTPWLGGSILCTSAVLFWIGWEINHALEES